MTYDQETVLTFLEEVWRLRPDASFMQLMDIITDEVDMSHLDDKQFTQLMKDFILQNM